jgi:hypothetical protein
MIFYKACQVEIKGLGIKKKERSRQFKNRLL